MTDNITLRRAAEQVRNFLHHLRKWDVLSIPNSDGAFWCREIDAAIAALDAALAEPPPQPEPVFMENTLEIRLKINCRKRPLWVRRLVRLEDIKQHPQIVFLEVDSAWKMLKKATEDKT